MPDARSWHRAMTAELVEAMTRAVIEDDDYWAEPDSAQNVREEQARALDAVLALPDLLIAALVERGALHQVNREPAEANEYARAAETLSVGPRPRLLLSERYAPLYRRTR